MLIDGTTKKSAFPFYFLPSPSTERDLPEERFTAVITTMMFRITILASILAVSLWCYGGGQQSKSSRLVTMHFEEESNSNPKMVTPVKLGSEHRQYFFSKMPTFTASDIQWFYPFTAEDGVTYGAAFRFKDYAARELEEQTLVNHGKLLGIRCSDAPLSVVLVDRPITDGVVVVWSGLQQRHLKEFQKQFPHVDDLVGATVGPEFELPSR